MAEPNAFHLSVSAAEIYDLQRVPAIFGPMAEATLERIGPLSGGRILDVACGTGAVAKAIGRRSSSASRITGADLNGAMIAVAREKTPEDIHEYNWVEAPAEKMPFEAGSFDLVFCQQGLQFFPDKEAALREMRRVSANAGRLIVTCWAETPPFFEIVAEALRRHLGEGAAQKAVKPFAWNDETVITGLIGAAGFDCPSPERLEVTRVLAAEPASIQTELLSSPYEPELRAAGEDVISALTTEIFDAIGHFRDDNAFRMPQVTYLIQAVAR